MRILYISELDKSCKNSTTEILSQLYPKKSYAAKGENNQAGNTRNELIQFDLTASDPNELLAKYFTRGPFDLIVGEGLGATFALIIGRAQGCRTLLISPLYPIKQYFPMVYPDYQYKEELWEFEHERICWDSGWKSLENIFVLIGKDDDMADTRRSQGYFYKGNCVYVPGGHSLSGNEFYEALEMLASSPELDSNAIRERIKQYNEEHSTSNSRLRSETVNEDEPENSPEKLEEPQETVQIIDIDGSNGNIIINWKRNTESRAQTLFLYFENGEWFKDTSTGRPNPEDIDEEITRKALPLLVANAKVAPHEL